MIKNKIWQEEKEKFKILSKNTTISLEEGTYYFIATKDIEITFLITQKTTVYFFTYDQKINMRAYLKEKANFQLFCRVISKNSTKEQIDIYHETPKTKSNISCHGIITEGELNFQINGYIPKHNIGCICNQESMIYLLREGKGRIDPNLYIEEFDVTANHSAFIGPFKEDELFYLQTKGISRKKSHQLLLKAFLLGTSENKSYEERIEKSLKHIME